MGLTIINGNAIDRVLDVNGSAVTLNLSDVKLTGGSLSNGSGGGGLFVQHSGGFATLTRVDIDNNDNAANYAGGGIRNNGTLVLTDSLVRNNSTKQRGWRRHL